MRLGLHVAEIVGVDPLLDHAVGEVLGLLGADLVETLHDDVLQRRPGVGEVPLLARVLQRCGHTAADTGRGHGVIGEPGLQTVGVRTQICPAKAQLR